MPNGGSMPDCLHCKNYVGRFRNPDVDPYCEIHRIKIVSPVYVFCSKYDDPSPEKEIDWLDQELGSREQLDNSLMYVWLGGYEIKFYQVPFVPIDTFAKMTVESFYDELGRVVDEHRNDD